MNARTLAKSQPGLSAKRARQLVEPCNRAMVKAGITTPKRAQAFLAQVGHESVSLRYKAEIGGRSTRYAPFYGRGFIQLTWRENYAFGRWLGKGDAFVRDPSLIERDDYAWLSAVYYWTTRGLNRYADRGDFRGLTKAINGGYNGLADREQRWARCRRLGSAVLPTDPDVLTDDERHHVDVALGRRGGGPVRRARARAWLLLRSHRIQRDARRERDGWNKHNRKARFRKVREAAGVRR